MAPAAFEAFLDATDGSVLNVRDSTNLPSGAGELVDWLWDFGDPGRAGNVLDGTSASHRYLTPGTYTITLTVTDEYGRQSTTSREVAVGAAGRPFP